jgi:hypothetical protein
MAGKSNQRKAPARPPIPTGPDAPWSVGTAYLIRTVTMYLIGRLDWVGPQELVLSDVAWVADAGRWHDALETGRLREVEPFLSPVILGRGAIVDATEWPHALPLAQC